jgi:coenzyme F420-dependent glucose-6-phosphate dehydrogenase
MVEIGYALSSEEHPAPDLVRFARDAERCGFRYASISDHFHPWIDRQGESSFVWSVMGGIAATTERLRLGTGVTCPIARYHPAIVAQAAATVATMMPGRFFLGVGTGENLNEHIVGQHWPPHAIRASMLEESIAFMRALWSGELVCERGEYFTVENARVYSLPDEPPPVIVAAGGPSMAKFAARVGDGLINFAPDRSIVDTYRDAGGEGPTYVQYNVCWAEDERSARKTALEVCPTVALEGELGQFLPYPAHFEAATKKLTEDDIAEVIVCGPEPEKHCEGLQRCIDAGFDHIHVDQVGPDQDGFFAFYESEVLPQFT